MLFNTAIFAICFILFFSVYYLFRFTKDQRIWFLFVVSVAFYATFSMNFIPYLLGTGLVDYYIADAIAREPERERRRKVLLITSLIMNLGVLAYFKYVNFFLFTATHIGNIFGLRISVRTLQIVLPVGISFYTFQSMSYV